MVAVTVEDMESVDPEYYKNLRAILEHPLVDLGLEDLTFSAESQQFGMETVVDLIPNGKNVKVTDENKNEYVTLICRHRMTSGIRNQIDNFLQVTNAFLVRSDVLSCAWMCVCVFFYGFCFFFSSAAC